MPIEDDEAHSRPGRTAGKPKQAGREEALTAPNLRRARWRAALLAALVCLAGGSAANAQSVTVRIARQFGISYMPLTIMEQKHLLEAQGNALGLDIRTEWVQFTSGTPMNEALISGNLDFASGGVGPLLSIWGKTRENLGVKAVAALNSMPLYLNTINPAVQTIQDFTDNDRIGLPAVRVSIQAITLQMAAEQAFGPGQGGKLDPLTVSLGHPDAMAQMMSGRSEITAHFGSAPFMYQELEDKRVHKVLDSYQVLGGPHTFNVGWARRVLGRGPIVLLISDGWDRGDPDLLRREMGRLQRSCHRLIWLNPLLGSAAYQPLTRGMQAALPFIDDFLPVHNLASLERLAEHLNALPMRRAPRRSRAATGPIADDARIRNPRRPSA